MKHGDGLPDYSRGIQGKKPGDLGKENCLIRRFRAWYHPAMMKTRMQRTHVPNHVFCRAMKNRFPRSAIAGIGFALFFQCDAAQAAVASPPPFETQAIPVTGSAPVPDSFDVSTSATGFSLSFPDPAELTIEAPTNCWMSADTLSFDLHLPSHAPADARLQFFLVDADYNWFQHQPVLPAATNGVRQIRIDLSSTARGWKPKGHFGGWHHRVRLCPKQVGLRLFSDDEYEGVAVIDNLRATAAMEPGTAPEIRRLRRLTPQAVVYERYELAIDLPDRYNNPFDPDEVSLTAEVEQPDGSRRTISGFYYQSYYRQRGEPHDRLIPQGTPHWRIRYTPMMPGPHRMSIQVDDRHGSDRSQSLVFHAAPPQRQGFARVSERDPRFFEFDDGSPFFPIGHNLRSPFDERMHRQFPWSIRHDEGSSIYDHYFRQMQAHGENITEVWMASWSLGIEWSRTAPGYHGIGQYNLMHAWELDQVIDQAERKDIYINLVLHNHGKFSTHWDPEWDDNPYNKERGGYLETPEDYFSDERAFKDFEHYMRYIIARWGASPSIFAWKLWNELDLTGSQRERVNYRRSEVVEWHRRMGAKVKQMDPYRHMIGTHFCGDYTHQNPEIIKLQEIDVAMIDAYHSNSDPLHIVDLMIRSARFNNRFDKPVVITEFGGSPHAATLQHLDGALHAGLWSSTAIPLGGAPMLWWWGLIEEQNYYTKFRALANFMEGEDRRNPDAALRHIETLAGSDSGRTNDDFLALSFMDSLSGMGWMADTDHFSSRNPPAVSNLVMRVDGMAEGTYTVEFWDTTKGAPVHESQTATRDGIFEVEAPVFSRDLAFKIRGRNAGEHP